jgi:hypothetical protein
MRRAGALALLALPAAAAACGAASPAPTPHLVRTTGPTASCAAAARGEIVTVARRIYRQAVSGRNEVAAAGRLARSVALARAVDARNPRAIRAALAPVIHNRIVRIDIAAGGRTLVRVGTSRAYAPVRGRIGTGSYVMSVGDQKSYEAITRGLTGATVTFGGSGGISFPATTFPGHATRVHIALPAQPAVACGTTAADTRAGTIGLIGRNLVYAESKGATAVMTLHHAAKNRAFTRAIASGSPAAVRAAIIGFFKDSHFHIVRVRAWKGGHLITDVGGPYVISPATMSLPGGGRFMLSVQDDTGYIKLMHRFTGADVVLRLHGQTVPGSNLSPGPPYMAGLSAVTYRGRHYRMVGFEAPAFPSGTLQVSLLVP